MHGRKERLLLAEETAAFTRDGIWPTVAPLGYRNVVGADGKKIIEPDPESAPIISRLFESYAIGQLSLKETAQKARAAGLVYHKTGRRCR